MVEEKKYVLVDSGKPVKIGDVIKKKTAKKTSFGSLYREETVLISPLNINSLIKAGIIKENTVVTPEEKTLVKDLRFYVLSLAKRMDISEDDCITMLDSINKVCPASVLHLILKEISNIAETIPVKGKNNEWYCIDVHKGNIFCVNERISSAACFKSIKLAEIARDIVKEQIDNMHGEA